MTSFAERCGKYYKDGLYTTDMLLALLYKGKLTDAEFIEITEEG